MIILTIAPTFPIAMEAIANMMPITDKINVTVHAHLFPFHNPYVITRYAIPNIKNIIPILLKLRRSQIQKERLLFPRFHLQETLFRRLLLVSL
jgi:hypothetical protein